MLWFCSVLADKELDVVVYFQSMKGGEGAGFGGYIAKGFPRLNAILTGRKELDQKQSKNENRPGIFLGVRWFHCCEFIQSWRIVATFEVCEG